MHEVTVDQLMNMCRASVSTAFFLEEDRYMTSLLSDNLTDVELTWVNVQEEISEPMCSIVAKLVTERMRNAASWGALATIEDAKELSSRLYDALRQEGDGAQYHAFIAGVIYRYIALFASYCALIHENQKVAITKLTMATSIYAISSRVSVDEAIISPIVRAQVIAALVTREEWWKVTTQMHKDPKWRAQDEGVKASILATVERRSREIWGK